MSGATPSPPDLHVDEVSGDESTEPEGRSPVVTWALGSTIYRCREWLPGSGMLYFFSQRVSLTICLYLETCT